VGTVGALALGAWLVFANASAGADSPKTNTTHPAHTAVSQTPKTTSVAHATNHPGALRPAKREPSLPQIAVASGLLAVQQSVTTVDATLATYATGAKEGIPYTQSELMNGVAPLTSAVAAASQKLAAASAFSKWPHAMQSTVDSLSKELATSLRKFTSGGVLGSRSSSSSADLDALAVIHAYEHAVVDMRRLLAQPSHRFRVQFKEYL
jgi:hypothetical protein